jgi:predicted nuclease of predicted toxin-antitoxin system
MQPLDDPTRAAASSQVETQTLRLLVDMNLSPDWVSVLEAAGHRCVHWASIGEPDAADATILEWARQHQHVVVTRDLDFGSLLALTQLRGPSVLQIRAHKILPEHAGLLVLATLKTHEKMLITGALIVIHERHARVRALPLTPP